MSEEAVAHLLKRRAYLLEQIKSMQARMDEIDGLLRVLSADIPSEDDSTAGKRPVKLPRGTVKETTLRLLDDHAEYGLTATELIEVAAATGVSLDRGSVSSLLSKLKSDGVLDRDGNTSKYRPHSMNGARA